MDIYESLVYHEIGRMVWELMHREGLDCNRMVQSAALTVLGEIQSTLQDESLSDFDAIEEIVQIFERHNLTAVPRHDF